MSQQQVNIDVQALVGAFEKEIGTLSRRAIIAEAQAVSLARELEIAQAALEQERARHADEPKPEKAPRAEGDWPDVDPPTSE